MPDDSGAAEPAHAVLRRETAVWHRAVEAVFAPLDLTRRRDLGLFLQAQARSVFAIEDDLERSQMGRLVPDWPTRRRSDALRADLRRLGLPAPATGLGLVRFEADGHRLGALYVLEGSRLGGRLLARQVAASEDPTVVQATAFLRHMVLPGAWAGFLAILNTTTVPVADLVEGATRAFRLYHDAAIAVTDCAADTVVEALVPPAGA